MTTYDRQQRMAERVLEDETLRGDLEDDAATALTSWASKRAAASTSLSPAHSVPIPKQPNVLARKPAESNGNRSPRKRSRLARFFKPVLGGR